MNTQRRVGGDEEERTDEGVVEEEGSGGLSPFQACMVGGGGNFVLCVLPSIHDPCELKRCQNEGWSLVSRQPNSEQFPHPAPINL